MEQARLRARAQARRHVAVAPYVRLLLAGVSFGAAAIHFAVAPEHFCVSVAQGTFFCLVAWAQTAFAVAVLLRPSRAVMRIGIGLNGAIVVAVDRVAHVGSPDRSTTRGSRSPSTSPTCSPRLRSRSPLSSDASTCSVPRERGRRLPFGVMVPVVVLASLAVVGTTTASIASALGGHTHGTSAIGAHQHGGSVNAAAGGGANGFEGHSHAVAASGIEAATGTSPCEKSGPRSGQATRRSRASWSVPQQPITDAATRAFLGEQLQAGARHRAEVPDRRRRGRRRLPAGHPLRPVHRRALHELQASRPHVRARRIPRCSCTTAAVRRRGSSG